VHTDVQALIKSKNRCLSQLIRITEEALSASSAFSALDELLPKFDQDRSALFRAIELVDQEITRAIPQARAANPPAQNTGLRDLVLEQQSLLTSLRDLDTRLLESLEAAIQFGQKEIQQTLSNREKLNRFKSQQVSESGEGLDQTL
jgi:hypothetical protein